MPVTSSAKPALDQQPSADQLETFPNEYPDRDYVIEIECPEFTSVCPRTGQPDFGTITFRYIPDKLCVELKSLKLYLQRYRNVGIFYEMLVNRLLDDFVAACKPRHCEVIAEFNPRGGMTTTVTAVYVASTDEDEEESCEECESKPRSRRSRKR
ncbi:MAG: preQ(1) synthase [Gemmatales bacterium]|nr:preQ(1) synthase [Gemmatales bacterium]MDW7993778.1 preQ(1) synthase [Gemmatales bacterium]